jgi:hypothetical protein
VNSGKKLEEGKIYRRTAKGAQEKSPGATHVVPRPGSFVDAIALDFD